MSWSIAILVAACIVAAPLVLGVASLLIFSLIDGLCRVLR